MISVIIPTYKEPDYLDLCLKSATEGQVNKNQIIVVVDGFLELNKPVLEKYKDKIEVLDLRQNCGLPRAINMGVYNAVYDNVLVVNDDNVFPKNWDVKLNDNFENYRNAIISPNQIEPNPSMFPQFEIVNYGKTVDEFRLDDFNSHVPKQREALIDQTGSTLPFMVKKELFLSLGGWDENYPTNGVVADWDFFLKCKNIGINMLRVYDCQFYHFAKVATGDQRQESEREGHEYSLYKWGSYIQHNPVNNEKTLLKR